MTNNPREAAYLAALAYFKGESYIQEFLDRWHKEAAPSPSDFNLAKEIAYGTVQRMLALDYLGKALADAKKLNLKLKEKALLRTALYQCIYLERLPFYAIANESVALAKKYCKGPFANFLNAVLRKFTKSKPSVPQGNSIGDLSIRYSYPPFFVQELLDSFGLDCAIAIMEAENRPGQVMFRLRPQALEKKVIEKGFEILKDTLAPMALLKDMSFLSMIASSPDYYIQNAAPAELLFSLAEGGTKKPEMILDLCAAPGGKLVALRDLFPNAELYANDISEKKMKVLASNIQKYGIQATLTCSRGEDYTSDKKFDIIVLDVPCSNSGVLNKRPEARWRLSSENVTQLESLQMALIRQAVSLLKEGGELWFMTCSILERENAQLVERASTLFPLKVREKKLIMPNVERWDGGFAAALLYRS